MRIMKLFLLGYVLGCAAAIVSAQTSVDRSFTTISSSCDGVRWSDRALQMYPTIASACQAVEARDGRNFVKFEGTVKRNADRGKQLVVSFKDGGDITLTPPPETNVYIDGQRTPVAELQKGDELTFYIAEDRLAAQFPETDAVTTRYVVVPIVHAEQAAATQPTTNEEPEQMASLPATAGDLPFVGLAAWVMLAMATLLTLFRRTRH